MRFTTLGRLLAVLAVMALLLPGVLVAQSSTQGAITGTVVDPTGAILPNIPVTIKNVDKGFSATQTTNSAGVFSFPLVEPGNYLVTIEATGFRQFSYKTSVQVGQATTLTAKLEVGVAGTTVEVSGEAPLVNVDTADSSTAFDQNLVANLPNGGNDLTAIAYTSPGIQMNSAGGYGNFNVNGLPATSNVFTVDGENQMDPFLNLNNSGPTNLMLGKNSIQEATVNTTTVSGQYGQQAGAQINFVSKGGTNNFHGNVNYQWTGSYLDANDWFNTAVTPTIGTPFANNNAWAASFGGPIKKDKLFFFVDTEGIRYIVPSTETIYTPTSGFLSDMLANLASPSVGASAATQATYATMANIWESAPGFSSGVPIPSAAPFYSCTDAYSGINPDPTQAACVQSYVSSPALPAHEWLLIGRFDYNATNKDRVFFRGDLDTGTQATYADPINPAFAAASYQPEYNNNLTWNHTFSGTMTNNFVAAVSYYRAIFNTEDNGPVYGQNTSGTPSPFPYTLIPVGDVGMYPLNALGDDFPQGRNVTQWQIIDDFAKTVGKHSLKFGINFRRYDITNYDASGGVTPEVVAGLNDWYNGTASFFAQNDPLRQSAPMNTGGYGIYAQDEYPITPRLKVTAALRLEHNFNPTCDTDCFTMPVAPFSSIVAQGASTPYNQALSINRNKAFNSVDAIDWSPRLGFIWSPRDNSKTVLTGSISLLTDAFPAFITDRFVNAPYLVGVSQYGPDFGGGVVPWADNTSAGAEAVTATTASIIRSGGTTPGGQSVPSLANGLTVGGLESAGGAPFSITNFPGRLKTPQYQEWNFSIQQALDSKSKLTLSYTGNHGIYEPYLNSTLNASTTAFFTPSATNPAVGTYSPNIVTGYPTCTPYPYGVPNEPAAGCSATPDTRFGSFTQFASGAVSNHNDLTVSYTRRATFGLVMNAAFTWGHTLDEISNGGLLPYASGGNIQGQINPAGLRLNNYGNADYDIRKSFNANYVWTEPHHFSNRAMNLILGNWIASENFIVRSGLPFTVTDGTTSISDGGTATPVQASGPAQQECVNGHSSCFNSGVFTPATDLGYFPTQTRNQYRGPGFFDSDFTIGKNFSLGERVKMNIGLNIYNVFNHPNFQNPGSSWTSSTCDEIATGNIGPSCGNITGQAAPPTGPYGSFYQGLPAGREGQLQAKINF
jgi:hypothetical protein